jgi:acetyl esterase/lipase
LVVGVIAFVGVGCSGEGVDVTDTTEMAQPETVRVAYGEAPEQFGDLYLPGSDVAAPVVVLIHGGFWRAQYGLDLMVPLADDLVGRGYAVWNIEYRRVGQPGGGYPGTLDDVRASIARLAELAGEHPIDVSRTAFVGHSAGGHLALWATGAGLAVVPVVGVGQGPVVDLRAGAELGLGGGAVVDFLGGTPADVPDAYTAATPALSAGPRMVAVVGSADDIVPAPFSEDSAQPGAIETVTVDGADHFDLIDPAHAAWAAVVDVLPAV